MTTNFDSRDLATMQANILHICEGIGRIEEKLDRLNGRVRNNESNIARFDTRWQNHKEVHDALDNDVDALETDVKKWTAISGTGAALVASLVAYITGK